MDDIDNDLDMENEPVSGIARWIPIVVVLGTIGGFIALACTAYHAGTQSLNEDDLPVVEADSSPMKEKPLDPGGMKFPNQDKTIFETFSANPPPTPKVERVLPSPEEPMPKQLDTSQTTTWVKDKDAKPSQPETLASAKPDKTPSVMGADTNKPIDSGITSYAANPTPSAAAPTPAPAPAAVAPTPAPVPAPAAKPAPVPSSVAPAPKAAPTPAPAKPAPAPAKSATASDGKTTVQLGAYRSENEAKDAWGKLQTKYKELSGHDPIVVKADLGDKGIYYRLRTGGFADAAAAKSLCKSLSAKGQACLAQ